MNGLNEDFMKGPDEFLRQFPLLESEELKDAKHPPGVYDFDLRPNGPRFFAYWLVGPEDKCDEKPIRAYWLPWVSGGTTEIAFDKVEQVENDKDPTPIGYFFTSNLEGCRLEIIPPGPAVKGACFKVVHIAGDSGGNKGRGPGGSKWRKEQAEKKLTKSERQRSRAFSSTVVHPVGYKEPDYDDADANVFGFRRNYRWEFWAQRLEEGTNKPLAWQLY